MIRIDYNFTAQAPIHTGSDMDMGTVKTLRRMKVAMREPVILKTVYTPSQRVATIVDVLYGVHRSIDWSKIKGKRIMGIWDEVAAKLLRAATAPDKYAFLEILCRSWDVRSVKNEAVLDALESLSSDELLDTVRNQSQYLVLRLRKKTKDDGSELPLFQQKEAESRTYTKPFDMVPCISGNSIRGVLRRLAMHDFCQRAGIKSMDKNMYHMLFTGGVLDQSTEYEDIERREQLIKLCPMLGVFGSAIGNMMIAGLMSVGMAFPLCREMGTGEQSYWEYLDTIFQTRHDDSKSEEDIDIQNTEESEAPVQMKYEYEVFVPGTPFSHAFAMHELDDHCTSAFWQAMSLFKKQPYVGGMRATGSGEIDLGGLVVPDFRHVKYVEYIAENADGIKAFFEAS